MLVPMWLLNTFAGLSGWAALPLVQLYGAVIFWYVDRYIFTADLDG
jgi:hypothetical protein